jgi:hypothetical protein
MSVWGVLLLQWLFVVPVAAAAASLLKGVCFQAGREAGSYRPGDVERMEADNIKS